MAYFPLRREFFLTLAGFSIPCAIFSARVIGRPEGVWRTAHAAARYRAN